MVIGIPKYWLIAMLLVFVGLVVNLGYLDWKILRESRQVAAPTVVKETAALVSPTPGVTIVPMGCRDECASLIAPLEEKINSHLGMPVISPTPITKVINNVTTNTAISYIPVASSGNTIMMNWTKVDGSQFVFDAKDYPSKSKVSWEVNLKVQNPNSRCSARIYDQTNLRAVDYSELSTTSTVFEYLASQNVAIWAGKNQYYLEIKSLDGSTCYISSPRLVIK